MTIFQDSAQSGTLGLSAVLASAMGLLRERESGATWDADLLEELIVRVGPDVMRSALTTSHAVTGRTGIGTPADVPLLAVFPTGGSTSAQSGYYVVYLFAKDGSRVFLSLNQGTERIRGGTPPLLKRALDMRTVLGLEGPAPVIDLRSKNTRPRKYEAGSANSIEYLATAELDETAVVEDLRTMTEQLDRLVSSGLDFHPEIEPVHMLFKWNADVNSRTIQDHRSIADSQGSVWWGRFARPDASGVSTTKLSDLKSQIEMGFATHAFLYRRGELWRASIEEATSDRDDVRDDPRFPGYYTPDDCNFFVRLSHFEHLADQWAADNLVLASAPEPAKLPGALSNQTTPLFVFERFDPDQPAPPGAANDRSGVWIFQANPNLYDFGAWLRQTDVGPGTRDSWTLSQHKNQVAEGDAVLLWSAGAAAGIYAVGHIVGAPFQRDRQDWQPDTAPERNLAIGYQLDQVLAEPILRSDLLQHPILKDLQVIRQPQGTNFSVTAQQWEALRTMIDTTPSIPHVQPGTQEPTVPVLMPDDSIDLSWLVSQTLWTEEEVTDLVDTLRTRRPQVVLAGPPGTGKTWVAEKIGLYLTGGRADAVHVVQFHPTYGYEDFVEGLRPVAAAGQVAFEVVPGALVQIADAARRAHHSVVLVIDEMNRANLPSVFGELLYLLEYRDKTIRLLHRPAFSLPSNLYIIGTMNTADRSIRSVDTAMRRRFDLFDCPPRPDILDSYFATGNHTDVADLSAGLEKLNARLVEQLDRHHTIGHSFFMSNKGTFSRHDLERTWRRQIQPLIEEYFFDQADLAESFTLEAFWPGNP